MTVTVGPVAACTESQPGDFIGPANVGMVPAGVPPAIPVPVPAISTDTGKIASGKTTKVLHEGKSFNNAKTIFKGIKGDELHTGTLPPKSDIISQTKCNEAYTIIGSPMCDAQGAGMVHVGNPAMGNSNGKLAQTPSAWVAGAGSGMFSAKCNAALTNAGIDPDDFGSLESKTGAQEQARHEYEAQKTAEAGGEGATHAPPCSSPNGPCTCYASRAAYEEVGREEFLKMNSQVRPLDDSDDPYAPAVEIAGDTEYLDRARRRSARG